MIELTDNEKKWILVCKGHFKKEMPRGKSWVETFKPLFVETFGWTPDDDNDIYGYHNCLFNRLLSIHKKIAIDTTRYEIDIREVFEASFHKDISNDSESPIERAICQLRSLICVNQVMVNDTYRYSLELDKK